MSRYDSESAAVTEGDSGLKSALETAERAIGRHDLEAKLAVTAAALLAVGFATRMAFTSQVGDNLGAMVVWFTVIFTAGTALLGGGIKAWGAIQRYRHDLQ
ncbi:hypothetical protein [Halobacterium litoreum]|uniref:Uncharacterized protein n=1 Tax=Halobacterium litoreum TaxID=2039234 RepID=A0ABD5NIV2_9EURY|nr:hypothetical protein [Halobacterium litoreum]UHH12228.1 hypothetical protein LT972_08670 [Halobacterium litoreum]